MPTPARRTGHATTGHHEILELHPGPDSLGVPLRQVVDEGRLVVVKHGLHHLDALEPLLRATARTAADHLPADACTTVGRAGIEALHTIATVEQATAFRTGLEASLRPLAADAALAFAAKADPDGPRVYVSHHLGVRLMLPHTAVAGRTELDPLAGFMVPHALHVDSWFNTALNSVNLWMALGRVRPGNGLLIYPDLYRAPVRRTGFRLAADQDRGIPVRVSLDPGDILVFAGDHVHGSETNTTDETRYIITKRISVGAPRFNPQGSGWIPYHDPRLLRGRLPALASLRSRATTGYARHLLRTALRRPPAYELPQPPASSEE
ncbi:phytanoyl-CoA dioxygenase family protein [Streptomyces sp. BE20]|uniref:phytanoyl-CoA dioxygenase family protein n=1 Tax=unclassified Streptomyces TaxID=2593676 RepID=UPI002E7856C2|nr:MULTISPECIES: phytanoyl-CoA dioxygenase family protein [unclassified Streptomyces]MED7948826.1 phytanoyl-CoA dioxygenase family protein [Streptomyces sp. BE303]MEE1821315.1 phytanoyl-CoA dioxygenase family protein [Streptomyces sp. BE20]